MIVIDPHVIAILCASNAACELLEVLPQNDLIYELSELLDVQNELILHIIEGKHYGSDEIQRFIEYASEITDQAQSLKEIG